MKVFFLERGWEYCLYQNVARKILKQVHYPIHVVSCNDLYDGMRKPKCLRRGFFGHWARRITDKDKLI